MERWDSADVGADRPDQSGRTVGAGPAAPALCAFACVVVGMVLARHAAGVAGAMWFALGCGACSVAAATRGRVCAIALAVGAVAFGGGWFALRVHERAGSTLDVVVAGHEGSAIRMRGVIIDGPERVDAPAGALGRFARDRIGWRCELRVDSIETDDGWVGAPGVVRLACEEAADPAFVVGQRVEVIGEARAGRGRGNPGAHDLELWGAMAHDAGFLRVPESSLIGPLPPMSWLEGATGVIRRALGAARGRAVRALGADEASDPDAALLGALILGRHERGLDEVRGTYTRVGLAHLLAISGFHLVVMTGALLLAIRLTGDRGWVEPALAAALVLAYLLIVPGRAPVVRAGAMVLGLLAADAMGRRYHRLAVLAWICTGLLVWRPMDVFGLGFQLSAGLTALLVWVGPRVQAWGTARPLRGTIATRRPALGRVWLRVRTAGAIALACWLVATPLVVHTTGLLSVLGVVSTLVVGPVIVAVLWIGYTALLVGLVVPVAGGALGDVAREIGAWASTVVAWIDALPIASVRLPAVSWVWALGATLMAIVWVRWTPRRSRVAWAMAGVVLAWGAGELGFARLRTGVALRLDTLDVGDGSCHMLRRGERAMLWDCGASSFSFGRIELARAVRRLGAGRVDLVVISHPNLDHYNALLDALEPLGVREVVVGEAFERWASDRPEGPEAFTLSELRRRGVAVRVIARGDRLSLGGAEIECLWPARGAEFASANDGSLVMRVRVDTVGGERSALLTGDSQDQAMEALTRERVAAEVLELPHHGSYRRAGEAFVESVGPAVVVQSTGPSRLWDERWERSRRGRAWLVTARDGACWVEIGADGEIFWGL